MLGEEQFADIMTKSLGRVKFHEMREAGNGGCEEKNNKTKGVIVGVSLIVFGLALFCVQGRITKTEALH